MGSNILVRNESMNEMIYEMNHILNCEYEIISSEAMILAVVDAILANA